MRHQGIMVFISFLMSVVFIGGCLVPGLSPGPVGGAEAPTYKEIDVSLSLSKIPKLNEPFLLYATFTPLLYDEPDMEAHVNLPSGAVYLDGDWKYRGPAGKGVPLTITTKLSIVEEGKWVLSAGAEAGEYRRGPDGQLERKAWYPVHNGSSAIGLQVTASGGSRIAASQGNYRPPPRPATNLGDALPIGMSGHIVTSELINNSDQPMFRLVNDKTGIDGLRSSGLVPSQPWGPWGPFLTRSAVDVLHTDFNLDFIVFVADRRHQSTGARFFIEGIEYGNGKDWLNVRVKAAEPLAGIVGASKSASPYDMEVLSKNLFTQGKAVDVRFLVNGVLQAEQSVVIRKLGQGVLGLEDVSGGNTVAFFDAVRQKVATSNNVPAANLEFDPSGSATPDSPIGLGVRLYGVKFSDKVSGKSYSAVVDSYGRLVAERDVIAMNEASRRAKLALAFGGVDPELDDVLSKQKDDYSLPVDIWFRPVSPGATYAETALQLVQALTKSGAQPQTAVNVPRLRAVLTKAVVRETGDRQDVAFISKSGGN